MSTIVEPRDRIVDIDAGALLPGALAAPVAKADRIGYELRERTQAGEAELEDPVRIRKSRRRLGREHGPEVLRKWRRPGAREIEGKGCLALGA